MTTPTLITCTLWASMWLNNGTMKILEEIKLDSVENTVTRSLVNVEQLEIQRYADFISILISRPPTEKEKEVFASFKHKYPLQYVTVARTSGSLDSSNSQSSVELGTKEYSVICKY
ncbi:MAG: hypothetical protein AABY53_03070 [Bdellovibrionota bacterium]